jgi:two-component system chemotaxis response regulator CheB
MAGNAVPILVVTTCREAASAHSAISKGALDVVAKPDGSLSAASDLIAKVKLLSKIKVVRHIGRSIAGSPETRRGRTASPAATRGGLVAIASSTGGPLALSVILEAIPEPFPWSIVIAQHHSDGFVPGMVEWFRRVARIPVKVAEDGDVLVPGTAYVSPSERHMRVTASHRVALGERQPTDIYRPSCDALLSSTARSCGTAVVGVILTGMGNDGAAGMQDIRDAGGVTIAQDEATCAVFGMPRVAIERGCIDRILPLDRIAAEIISLVARAHGVRKGL